MYMAPASWSPHSSRKRTLSPGQKSVLRAAIRKEALKLTSKKIAKVEG